MDEKKALVINFLKSRRGKTLLIIAAVILVLAVSFWFFVFQYAPSAIGVRRFIASKIASPQRQDTVRSLYEDILRYDPERVDSYLEIAGYEEDWEEYPQNAWDRIVDGIKECGKEKPLIKKLTSLTQQMADLRLDEGEYTDALALMKDAVKYGVDEDALKERYLRAYEMQLARLQEDEDYEKLVTTFEGYDEKYQSDFVLRDYYCPAYLELIRIRLQGKDAEAALELLERLPSELADRPEIDVYTLEAYLLLAKQYIVEGDDINALAAIEYAMQLSPENEVARLLYLQLTGAEDTRPAVDSFTIDGTLNLHMTAGAFVITTPLEITAPIHAEMSGLTGDAPILNYSMDVNAEALGETTSLWIGDEVSGTNENDSISAMKNAYQMVALSAVADGSISEIDGIPCLVYTYKVERGDLSALADAIGNVFASGDESAMMLLDALPLTEAEVTRYVSQESGELVRLTANLDQTDFAQILAPYIEEELPAGSTLSSDSAELVVDITEIIRK